MRRQTATAGTAALGVAAAVVVWLVTTRLFPYHSLNHDEAVYLQQAAMLLEAQLSLHPPVEGVFRPWFFFDSEGGLYPKYAPVPAATFAVGKLFGSYRFALVAVAAGNVSLLAGVVREAFDARTGLLAAGFLLASPLFVINSAVFLPYAPTTLWNLAFAYAYLRADRTGDRRWAAVAGVAVGVAFFSRPYTAVLFATPFIAHALWTLWVDRREALPRQATTAGIGLTGVAVALGYNALVTGSPIVFPYEAFAPLDGLGFGHRQILAHEVEYTPELALRANRRVLQLFFAKWVAGGLVGTALAALGLGVVFRRGLDTRQAAVVGVAPTVAAGNVFFWGNFNVLGNLDRAGDGLVAVLGPYYHFDMLLPTAALAAVGTLALLDGIRDVGDSRLSVDRRQAQIAVAVAVLVLAGAVGVATGDAIRDPVERNAEATETYETAYEPFDDGSPPNSIVLVPDPYGDWLNHPFQPLRNDPGFDGRAVYALDDRPFDTADAFPDRTIYRYAYRGSWSPLAGTPRAARLQRVQDVQGEGVVFRTTVGVPEGARSVTARVGTEDGSAYYVGRANESVTVTLRASEDRVTLSGLSTQSNETLELAARETVRLSVFVDYGPGGSFTYRFDLPVEAGNGEVRALSPRVELCRGVRACGGAAAYVPERAPDGVFVETNLSAERNS